MASNYSLNKYCLNSIPDMLAVCEESETSGVTCADSSTKVIAVDLSSSGMSGTLPEDIGALGPIVELYLNDNNIQSPLPESIATLESLEVFDISGCDLGNTAVARRALSEASANVSSEIFKSIGALSRLTYLDVSENGLTGAVPDSLCDLPLKSLYLMNPQNFSDSSSSEQGISFLSEKANNFSCIPRCFYGNPNKIDLAYNYLLPYCGQTPTPTSEPTSPNLERSTGALAFNTTQMSTLMICLGLLLLLLLLLVYYFCCYSNVSLKNRDENLIYQTAYIDIDTLKANERYSRNVLSDNASDDTSSYGEDDANSLSFFYRHDDQERQSASTPSREDDSNEDALQAWNEELIDFQKGNVQVQEANVPEDFFDLDEDVDSDAS